MRVSANPHLPPAPVDGKHDFEGSARCAACGAYGGSVEAARTCRGEWAESGKMRVHAEHLWHADLLAEGPPGSAREVAQVIARTIGPRRTPGVLHSTETRYSVSLSCGHERSLEAFADEPDDDPVRPLRMYDSLRRGEVLTVACVDPGCPLTRIEQHYQLNPHLRSGGSGG